MTRDQALAIGLMLRSATAAGGNAIAEVGDAVVEWDDSDGAVVITTPAARMIVSEYALLRHGATAAAGIVAEARARQAPEPEPGERSNVVPLPRGRRAASPTRPAAPD